MPRQLDGPVAVISIHASPVGPLGRGENGGGNLAVLRLCEGLAALGIPSDVYVRREDPGSPSEELLAPMSRLVRLDVGPSQPIPKQQVAGLADEFAAAVEAHARSERRRYAVIHAHYWLGGLVAERLRRSWGTPWVQSFHTLARTKARAGGPLDVVRSNAETEMVRIADRLVAGSVAEARDLMRLYGAARTRICVAQPGVDLGVLTPRDPQALREQLGIEGGRRVLLFAGRLEPLKGPDTLLRAVAELAQRDGFDDVLTLVVGDDSSDGTASGGGREHLETLVAERGIADRVRFVGAVDHAQLADWYAIADLCVVPSRTETFGLVALEAQALGTPVVASAVGGLTEVVDDGVTGVLVHDRTPSGFADAIAGLLDNPQLRSRMSDAARDRGEAFTWARASERLAAIYGRVTSPQAPSATPCGYADDLLVATG